MGGGGGWGEGGGETGGRKDSGARWEKGRKSRGSGVVGGRLVGE